MYYMLYNIYVIFLTPSSEPFRLCAEDRRAQLLGILDSVAGCLVLLNGPWVLETERPCRAEAF